MKPQLCISFSGGRTSAYMAKLILDLWSHKYEIIIIYANTGLEHEKTLEFIRNCDDQMNFRTVWVEAVVHHGERTGTSHKIVNFETAARNGDPFEEVIKKYGVPNTSYPHCTRELKLAPITTLLKECGFKGCQTAIGIRADESRRVSDKATEHNIIYPLCHNWMTTKRQVLEFWGKQDFDLGIEEFEGNCLGCFKKSFNKHFAQIKKDPSVYDFFRQMEKEHSWHRGEESKFFRDQTSTNELFELYFQVKDSRQLEFILSYNEDGGCSESCEVFDMS